MSLVLLKEHKHVEEDLNHRINSINKLNYKVFYDKLLGASLSQTALNQNRQSFEKLSLEKYRVLEWKMSGTPGIAKTDNFSERWYPLKDLYWVTVNPEPLWVSRSNSTLCGGQVSVKGQSCQSALYLMCPQLFWLCRSNASLSLHTPLPNPSSAVGHISDPVWKVTWGSVLRGPLHLLVPVCGMCHCAFPLQDPNGLQPGENACHHCLLPVHPHSLRSFFLTITKYISHSCFCAVSLAPWPLEPLRVYSI